MKILSMLPVIMPIIVVVILVLTIFAGGLLKAPPDTAFIISGLGKRSRILIGRTGIKIPLIERLDKLSMKLIPLDIKTKDAVPTKDCINIFVDSAVNIKVKNDPTAINIAAQNFLNKKPEEIGAIVSEVLEGNIREIICTMQLRDLIGDRKNFVEQVSKNVVPDLEHMGLDLVSFNVQTFRDENGVINDLGIDNISQIKKDAAIAKANADKEVAIAQSNADREANDARVLAETEIAARNNELEIKKADLKRLADVKKAEADAAYSIQQQEQEKSIQTATVNAQIAKAEREAELKEKEISVKQKALEAEINKKADAERYEVEQRAAADLTKRQREAEAKKYEAMQDAEARKAQAEAEKYAMEMTATGIRAKGEAEALAIQAKGEAEAAAMEKKAQAYQKYNNAAMVEMIIQILPQMASEIAKPLGQIDKINIYGGTGASENGAAQIAGNVPAVMKQVFDTMSDVTGVDFTEIMRANTYDAKVNKHISVEGLERVIPETKQECVDEKRVDAENVISETIPEEVASEDTE